MCIRDSLSTFQAPFGASDDKTAGGNGGDDTSLGQGAADQGMGEEETDTSAAHTDSGEEGTLSLIHI